jgi:hypothetical protein
MPVRYNFLNHSFLYSPGDKVLSGDTFRHVHNLVAPVRSLANLRIVTESILEQYSRRWQVVSIFGLPASFKVRPCLTQAHGSICRADLFNLSASFMARNFIPLVRRRFADSNPPSSTIGLSIFLCQRRPSHAQSGYTPNPRCSHRQSQCIMTY